MAIVIALKALSPKADGYKVAKFSWSTIVFILSPIVLFGLMLTYLLFALHNWPKVVN